MVCLAIDSGKIVSDLKGVNDLMNKNLVNIAYKFIKKNAFYNNREFCFSSVCNDFVLKELIVKLRCTLGILAK